MYKDPWAGSFDDAGKITRNQMTKYFLSFAKEYDFYPIAEGGVVSKILTGGETKADLCFRMKTKTKQKTV